MVESVKGSKREAPSLALAMHGGRGRSPFQKMAFLRRATSDDALDFYRVMVAGKRKEGEGGGVGK